MIANNPNNPTTTWYNVCVDDEPGSKLELVGNELQLNSKNAVPRTLSLDALRYVTIREPTAPIVRSSKDGLPCFVTLELMHYDGKN